MSFLTPVRNAKKHFPCTARDLTLLTISRSHPEKALSFVKDTTPQVQGEEGRGFSLCYVLFLKKV